MSQRTMNLILEESKRARVALEKILKTEEKLLAIYEGKIQSNVSIPESKLLQLPDHIRKSYMVILENGSMTATQVAEMTGRARAVESCYLNQLVVMGKLVKYREKRQVIFARNMDV